MKAYAIAGCRIDARRLADDRNQPLYCGDPLAGSGRLGDTDVVFSGRDETIAFVGVIIGIDGLYESTTAPHFRVPYFNRRTRSHDLHYSRLASGMTSLSASMLILPLANSRTSAVYSQCHVERRLAPGSP